MKKIKTDVFILGGGSGGMGCLYRLAKNGVKVILCDKNSGFGGTSVYSGVSCWEPGVSLDGLHLPLAEELMKSGAYIGKSVSNGRLLNPEISDDTVINDFSKYPWGLSAKDKFGKYEDTLKRCNMFFSDRLNQMRRFQFDGDYINPAMKKILKNYENNFTAFFNTSLVSVKTEGDRVVSCTLDNGVEIEAKYFVDCGGNNIPLIRMCNCGTASDNDLNGVTYVFRVRKTDGNHIDDINTPIDYSKLDPIPISCFNIYPNGDININMLPTMTGGEYVSLGENADKYAHALIRNYWNFLQREKGLSGYTLIKIFNAGIRERYCLCGKHILTEDDIRQGIFSQRNNSHIIAIGDHMLDIHGGSGLSRELDVPYGIPIECCMTNEFENLFAACCGASFSHIASSSVRLSRTMMSLGEGVGEYLSQKVLYGSVDFEKIQKSQKFNETVNKWIK